MKIIDLAQLSSLQLDDMRVLTRSGADFLIRVDLEVGERIRRFLLVESTYRSSRRTVLDRLRYVIGGMRSIPDASFATLWNRALIDGYSVQDVRTTDDGIEIVFKKFV